jgi:DNA modification methylase
VQLIHGDCLEVLRTLPDASVDAVVTDPPYFLPATHYQSRVKHQRKFADAKVLEHWWGMVCDELARVQKPNGHTLVFCNADSYPSFYAAMYERWDKLVCLVWDKDRPGMGRVWRHQHELIIAARNSGAYEPQDGRLRADVLRYKATLPAERDHPVQKPAAMLIDLIQACTPAGGMVLDPFMGSGTTGEAAQIIGRDFIGIELDEKYHAIAERRIAAAQPPLFAAAD